MPLEYDVKNKYESLLPVLDEHSEWFHCVIQSGFYPDLYDFEKNCENPVSFAQWTVTAEKDQELQPELLEKLTTVHYDLMQSAKVFMLEGKKKGNPSHKAFAAFVTLYEEFQNNIRRLEKDFMREDSGYDSFTGLRSKKMMLGDIGREMHRLARQGKKFTLALTRIDKFALISTH